MEYADGGSLQSYLKENFNNLEWSCKYQLALQLANAVACMHNEGIIHCDLHAQNVLVHQNHIKLADFGLSRKISDISSYSTDVFGVVPYIDPNYLNNIQNKNKDKHYKLNTKSDVYSVGILLWQISSGHKPFYADNIEYDANLIMKIREGKRETIVVDTPIEYSNLFEACWKDDPNVRPTMQNVVKSLQSIIFGKNNRTDERFDKAFYWYQQTANNGNLCGLLNLGKCYELGIGVEKNETAESGNINAQNMLTVLYETGEGIKKDLKMSLYWCQKAADNGDVIGLCNLGEHYEFGNGVKIDEYKAFEFYQKAANQGDQEAKFHLGYCYVTGIGTEINKEIGFKLYNEAARNKDDNMQHIDSLDKMSDLDKLNYWYHKVDENDNKFALYKLGEFYELGKGISENLVRAFEFYKKSANKGCLEAQYKVGYFYDNGIVIDIDKARALELYKVAANEGSCEAQKRLAYLYESDEGTDKNIENAINWYKKAVENGCQDSKENLTNIFDY
ncbi:20734_t:CDS:2 [Funneliformis geosporum]|nr:20734_t:CDS:2 [Funneliformis geosporum]